MSAAAINNDSRIYLIASWTGATKFHQKGAWTQIESNYRVSLPLPDQRAPLATTPLDFEKGEESNATLAITINKLYGLIFTVSFIPEPKPQVQSDHRRDHHPSPIPPPMLIHHQISFVLPGFLIPEHTYHLVFSSHSEERVTLKIVEVSEKALAGVKK